MAGAGNGHQQRTWNRLGNATGILRRRQLVFLADNHQRGHGDLRQQGGGVGAVHHAMNRAANGHRRLLLDQQTHLRFGARVQLARRLAQQLGHHLPRHARRTLAIDQREHVAPVGAPLRGIRGGAGVGQHQGLDDPRRILEQRQRDVPTHRQSADHRPWHRQRFQQIHHVTGVVGDGQRAQRVELGRTAETSEIGGDQPPPGGNAPHLRLPLVGAERKRVQQHVGPQGDVTGGRIKIGDRAGADVTVLARHSGVDAL